MDWLVFVLWVLIALVLVGAICYPLGWIGSVMWLLACGLAALIAGPYTYTGGCDGGLCILGYLFHYLFVLIIWIVLWLVTLFISRTWRKQKE